MASLADEMNGGISEHHRAELVRAIAQVKAENAALCLMEKNYRMFLDELKNTLQEIGGCDHAINICVCHLIKLAEDSELALANLAAVREGR